jgi:hypothetical protein
LAAVEILSVTKSSQAPVQLLGANIERPVEGQTADEAVVRVVGWAIGRSAPAVAVEVVSGDRVLLTAPLRTARPDLQSAFPQAPEAGMAGMAVDLDTSGLPKEFEVVLRAVLKNDERIQIGSFVGRQGERVPPVPQVRSAPTLEKEVAALLRRVAPEEAASEPHADEAILDRIRLQGLKVLDVGAGIGERCRAARARGAALVDGFEADAQRARIARLLNAQRHVTRVSIYERDIGQPESYGEPYDVVLALSTFDSVVGVLDKVAGFTDGVLVTALPDLEESRAIVGASLPHHQMLDADRRVIAAARTRDALVFGLHPEAVSQAAG